ncbi:hypothetical protein BCh11DRAFT_06911 [Burkholderia sp. Ch1-1]|uniref:Uncharacterized protein n=1 Tax=Paraburkholderia dioscoreae TaxID=2604047 RepID=A0A5Q4Z9P4_9BURK|nr:hypothetical protein BCh11DRAFT_06911 [Burkholderia sp. Ch1-1]VVD28365.1 conserved protein of unknown function [Paraburkholderia dioscoreae]
MRVGGLTGLGPGGAIRREWDTRMGHKRGKSGANAAEKACRCGWCIAEVGQNPLNYNFLAALRRPSLICRHKPR